MHVQTIITFNENTLAIEETKFEDFHTLFEFIRKKEDPSPATLEKLRKYVDYYKKSSITFEDPLAKIIFEKHILRFPTLHVFEDKWGTDHDSRRKYCRELRLTNQYIHDMFACNKFQKDHIRHFYTFLQTVTEGWSENVKKIQEEIYLLADMRTSGGRDKFQKMSFLEKRLFVDRIEKLAFAIMEDVLEPIHTY